MDGGPCWGLCIQEAPTDPDLALPTQDFDQLLETLRASLSKDPGTGFVFSCLSGQGRTTTAMVVAVLAFWHIQVRVASPGRLEICPEGSGHSGPRHTGPAGGCEGHRHPGVVPEPLPSVLGSPPVLPSKGLLALGGGFCLSSFPPSGLPRGG